MVITVPLELLRLLKASEAVDKEAAWDELISRHSRVILAVARSLSRDRDEVMDRYTYVLGKLRESDFRRLRRFQDTRGAAFSTWLAATVRNLCLDHYRSRFGRTRLEHSEGMQSVMIAARRALHGWSFGPTETSPDTIVDETATVETSLILADRNQILRCELEKLTGRERLLLTLRFKDELSAARIASIVGLPTPFHVYRHINSLLDKLRTQLRSAGVDDADG